MCGMPTALTLRVLALAHLQAISSPLIPRHGLPILDPSLLNVQFEFEKEDDSEVQKTRSLPQAEYPWFPQKVKQGRCNGPDLYHPQPLSPSATVHVPVSASYGVQSVSCFLLSSFSPSGRHCFPSSHMKAIAHDTMESPPRSEVPGSCSTSSRHPSPLSQLAPEPASSLFKSLTR
jgi:hypothetical protein